MCVYVCRLLIAAARSPVVGRRLGSIREEEAIQARKTPVGYRAELEQIKSIFVCLFV